MSDESSTSTINSLKPNFSESTNLQIELAKVSSLGNLELEKYRSEKQEISEFKRLKLEMVRLARDTLVENSRSKPVDSRDVSEDDIINYASKLVNYVNG